MVRPCLDIFPWSESEGSDSEVPAPQVTPISPICLNSWTTEQLDASPSEERCEHGHEDLVMRVVSETLTASKILWHCVRAINALRDQCGGPGLCVFKIGLTANPTQRRQSYLKQNFKQFVIVHKVTRTDLLGMLEMLEAALIAEFHDHGRCCRNKQLGGESMRDKSFEPRFPPPYFAYCAATNASQREPILG